MLSIKGTCTLQRSVNSQSFANCTSKKSKQGHSHSSEGLSSACCKINEAENPTPQSALNLVHSIIKLKAHLLR